MNTTIDSAQDAVTIAPSASPPHARETGGVMAEPVAMRLVAWEESCAP